MLSDLGSVAASASEWGIPLLAMVYARGPKVEDEYAPDVVAIAHESVPNWVQMWSKSTTQATLNPLPM